MLLQFNIDQEASRLLLGIAYQRLYTFFMKYDAAATIDQSNILTRQILKRLIDHDETLHLYLYLTEGKVIGHALLSLEKPEMTAPYIYVHQCECDDTHATQDFLTEALAIATQYGASQGCNRLMMTTAHRPLLFKRYGFEVFRVVMTRDIVAPHVAPQAEMTLEEQLAQMLHHDVTQSRAQHEQQRHLAQIAEQKPIAPSQHNGTPVTLTPELMSRLQQLLTSIPTSENEESTQDTENDGLW